MLSNSHRQCEVLKGPVKRKDQPPSPTSDGNEVHSRIDSPRKGPTSGIMSPTLKQRGAELLTRMSSTTTPRVAGSKKPKDTSQPKVNTAPTVPQEQVQIQSSSPKVKRLSSTSSPADRKQGKFKSPQTKAKRSNLTSPLASSKPQPKGVTRGKAPTKLDKEVQPCQERDSVLKKKCECQSELQRLHHDNSQLQAQVREHQERVLSKEKALTEQTAASKAMEEQFLRQLQDRERASREKEEEYERKLSESAAWRSHVGGAEGVIEQLQLQMVHSDEQLIKAQQQLQAKEQELELQASAMERQLQQLQKELREQTSASEAKEGTLQRHLQDQEREFREKEEEYKTKLKGLSSERSKLTQQEQAATWKATQQQLQQKVQDLQRSVDAKEEECQQYREQERASKEKIEQSEDGLKSLSDECTTLKSTKAKLEEQLKQSNKQLQTVVSYCEGQLKLKAQELASAQAKETQLQGEVQKLQTSLSAMEKELRMQEQALEKKKLDHQQELNSLSQQCSAEKSEVQQELTQAQKEAQIAQQQVHQRNQIITDLQQQWKELLEAEGGQVSVTTQPSSNGKVASGRVQ